MRLIFASICMLCLSFASTASAPEQWLGVLDSYPHAGLIASSEKTVRDIEVGTGALQKVRGAWRFKSSARRSGKLSRLTWQIIDGYSAAEVFQSLVQEIESASAIAPLFACSGRSCGPSVQWANRVFQQRLLYGRAETQRYAVYEVEAAEASTWVVAIYAAGRTAQRQYLHIDLLKTGQHQ